MATKLLKETAPLSGTSTSLLWGSCEIYVCGDPDCRSKVLVLQPPLKDPRRVLLPRCVCGSILEISGSVAFGSEPKPLPPGESAGRDPLEERE